jgi:hypothetical protein
MPMAQSHEILRAVISWRIRASVTTASFKFVRTRISIGWFIRWFSVGFCSTRGSPNILQFQLFSAVVFLPLLAYIDTNHNDAG